MDIIKGTTKKGQDMLAKAQYCEGRSLFDVYSSFSQSKERAFEQCLAMCNKENGNDFRIISHNTFQFSVAWNVKNGIRVKTASSSYLMKNALLSLTASLQSLKNSSKSQNPQGRLIFTNQPLVQAQCPYTVRAALMGM